MLNKNIMLPHFRGTLHGILDRVMSQDIGQYCDRRIAAMTARGGG